MAELQQSVDYFRFCRGEEAIKLSNAVCRGRRRANFPKCPGCQFNDEERAAAALAAAPPVFVPGIETVFRADDICATFPSPLSLDYAWRIGHAIGQFLHGKLRGLDRAERGGRSIIVGRDVRTSSRVLQGALVDGMRSTGMEVTDLGVVDTPQVGFAVNHFRACGGVQTTGGRRPAEFNGFRLFGAKGVPISADTGLSSIRDIAQRVPRHDSGTTAARAECDLTEPYRESVRRFLHRPDRLARPLKTVVDAGNGVAGIWARRVFEGLAGLTIVPMNCDADASPMHGHDPHAAERLAPLGHRVREKKADLGVAFSEDADVCAFVDEKGAVVGADLLGAALARRFVEREPGAVIALDLRASRAAGEEIERAGGIVVRPRIGRVEMQRMMSQRGAVFGADIRGRFFFRGNYFGQSAFIALSAVLDLIAESDRPLSGLMRPLQRFRRSDEVSFRCEDAGRAVEELTRAHPDAEVRPLDGVIVKYPDWWFHARPGRGEPLVRVVLEAKTKKAVEKRLCELAGLLGPRV